MHKHKWRGKQAPVVKSASMPRLHQMEGQPQDRLNAIRRLSAGRRRTANNTRVAQCSLHCQASSTALCLGLEQVARFNLAVLLFPPGTL